MSDLISRQDAIDEIHEDIDWLVAQGGRDLDLTECMERAKSILSNLPSADEPHELMDWQRLIVEKMARDIPSAEPEIIQCKDCKYWNHETDLTYCERVGWTGTDAYDYCSFAERKEDG